MVLIYSVIQFRSNGPFLMFVYPFSGEDGKRTNRQLKDAEFGNKDISNLQELMDVLPNIDVSDVMEIPKVFQCDEQTLPCDHTTKFRYSVARFF